VSEMMLNAQSKLLVKINISFTNRIYEFKVILAYCVNLHI